MDTHTEKYKVRLGLFIAGGLALFVLAVFIIGRQQNLFRPVFQLTTNFYNASGLQVGNNVRFTGINVGTVDHITIINDSTVRVDMLIKRSVQQFIKSDCEVTISSEGLIGDRILVITYGSPNAPIVEDGQQLKSIEPFETDAIMASLQISASNAEVITRQLAEVLTKVNTGHGTLGRLIHDTIIAQNLNQTIANLKKSSQGLDETIEVVKHDVTDIMGSIQVTSGNIEVFSQQLGDVMLKVNSENGNLNKLLQDSTLVDNLSQTMVNLRNSSKGLDENMEALKHNFLFKGYFKRKAKAAAKLEKEKALETSGDEKDIEKRK